MALCTVHFRSESIQMAHGMNVILPDKGRGPFPVLYLLHGLSDDYTIWCRRTSIERHVAELQLIVVMPETHRFWYVNDPRPGGLAYEDHIIKDVVGFVDRTFPTVRSRRARAVAGLSMGGYGAMMLAMRHGNVFSTAASHSGAFIFVHGPRLDVPGTTALADALPKRQYDLWELAKQHAKGRRRLALRFDCGRGDWLIGSNRKFHRHLERLGIEHGYDEFDGAHDWAYWDTHIKDTLAFVMKHVRK